MYFLLSCLLKIGSVRKYITAAHQMYSSFVKASLQMSAVQKYSNNKSRSCTNKSKALITKMADVYCVQKYNQTAQQESADLHDHRKLI